MKFRVIGYIFFSPNTIPANIAHGGRRRQERRYGGNKNFDVAPTDKIRWRYLDVGSTSSIRR